MEELSREDVRALAGEVLEALGVETVEMDEEEREAVRKAVEAWRKGKTPSVASGDSSLDEGAYLTPPGFPSAFISPSR